MAETKESTSSPLAQADSEDVPKSPPSSPNSSTREVCLSITLSTLNLFVTLEKYLPNLEIYEVWGFN